MEIIISETKAELGRQAAEAAAAALRGAISARGEANLIVATGASQFEMLAELVQAPKVDWGVVTAFHLDEYVGMPATHPASFRRYLRERFVDRLPQPLAAFYAIDAETDPPLACAELGAVLVQHPIDVALIGIGENGHLAFNDPPADFVTELPYLVVALDEACRRQQLNEGWFSTLAEVPKEAVSMSIRQILKSRELVVTVPDRRKAAAVKNTVQGPITPDVPASILQNHPHCRLFLDRESASLLGL
ncbi:MAG TPA: glucosamine-6-phosphate deaminase [Pirellulales bacterium]|jgi:glucosamine-6-phosphate deaminase|nr:glucosamine-6-phosphate deaminase [Pirellulales bacterium]